ncbi:tryptophan synthase subunit beta [Rubellimicrobium roseum]|uniref:Tryptophan synthase subunit beta n=1 Tax=Rubellimicrobium roseum TaxID=687525 RepID=A0A5C4NMS8_9RHOB|nr:tryptophan synthase subunit beta [Rubellimicrobium roseum]TNC74738.1 tryptophan synthase subunit beta [Rubellimicrobium roseum]
MPHRSERLRQKQRLLRQFRVLERRIPSLRRPLRRLLREGSALVRLPIAFTLMAGGLLSFLPFLGVWMLPLGLLLLAVDIPALRPTTSALMIRGRRWTSGRIRRIRIRQV